MAERFTQPTFDAGQTGLSAIKTPEVKAKELAIVAALESYRIEAELNRRGGPNNRDDKWEENLNLYWNRYDFGDKANWQAREVMPEVPQYVDRFAAALKEALVASDTGFYTVRDPSDTENDMAEAIKRVTDVWLSRAGRNQMGQVSPFPIVFEEQMKLGSLMATSAVVTWKNDVPKGRVAIETVDPRFVWLDHTNRNLYRMRRVELDLTDLKDMCVEDSQRRNPIYDMENMHALITGLEVEMQQKKEEASGHGAQVSSGRSPVILDEWIATVVDNQGNKIADRSLMVVANNKHLIRGPEKNPFWHGTDWLVFAPLVTVPLSVYGRSYMEDFGAIARTFTNLTNMLLDATYMSSLKAFAAVPSMLIDPTQANEGVTANKLFLLEEGTSAKDFIQALDLGTLSPDGMRMWQEMKRELSEAAGINEIGLGQFAPKGRTSATEISAAEQNSSALIRSLSKTIEYRHLNPILDLTWKTGLQHADVNDPMLAAAAGPEMWQAMMARRREFIERPITFQANGLTAMIRKGQMLRALMQLLGIVAQNDILMQAFLKKVSIDKLLAKLFEYSDIDMHSIATTEREQMVGQVMQGIQAAEQQAGGGQPQPGGGAAEGEMGNLLQGMGLA